MTNVIYYQYTLDGSAKQHVAVYAVSFAQILQAQEKGYNSSLLITVLLLICATTMQSKKNYSKINIL